MQEQQQSSRQHIKPNLKHDNMEYTASTDGDDILDSDKVTNQDSEDEAITAEELELLHNDDVEDLAAALNSAEIDSQADEDNFINEKEVKDQFEESGENEGPHKRG